MKKEGARSSPWERGSYLTKYSLSFVIPMVRLAWKNDLKLSDIPPAPQADRSRLLGEQLERNYLMECERLRGDSEKSTASSATANDPKCLKLDKTLAKSGDGSLELGIRRPSLVRALFRTFGLELVLANLFNFFVRMILFPLQTITLGWMLEDIRNYSNLRTISGVFVEPTAEQNQTNLLYNFDYNDTHPILSLGANITDEPTRAGRHQVELEMGQVFGRILKYLYVLIATTCLASCLLHPFFFQTYHLGMKCRVAACHLIYKKATKLSQLALSEATAGQMINLLSNDVNRFDTVVQTIPFLVDGPIQVVLITFILTKYYLGLWPTLAGLLVVLLFMLVQGLSGKLFSRFRSRAAERTDERVRLMSEIIQAIKVIKMYAWERAFWGRIMSSRRRELSEIRNTFLIRCLNQTLFFMSSKIIVFVMLMVYVALDCGPLSPELVFVTIGLSNLIRVTVSMYLANAIAQCAETLISCERIGDFLLLPEIQSRDRPRQSADEHTPGRPSFNSLLAASKCADRDDKAQRQVAIQFERAYAWWTSKEHMVLRNLSANIESGELVLLVGRVGSGKSSVLLSILGELPLASGRLEIGDRRVSYAAQEAWLFAGTVRENILFGEPLLMSRYQAVVRVCCLERDFKDLLARGDQTVVGERGSALSGGQRARINLARALYREADIYLLDDPLAALDAPVARHIVSECLARPGGFLAGKTVLLATHQLQLLRLAERVLLVDQRAPALFGTPADILNSDKFKLVDYAREALADAAQRRARPPPSGEAESAGESSNHDDDDASEYESLVDDQEAQAGQKGAAAGRLSCSPTRAPENKELSCGVASDSATYLYYLRNSFRPLPLAWFLLIVVVSQAVYLWIDFMLSRWTDAREQLETLGEDLFEPQTFIDRWSLAQVSAYYAGSILAGLLAVGLLCLTYALASIRASKRLHESLLARLLAARMSHFESTSIGVLLNRVSRDLGFIDQTLPLSALDIIMIFSNILAVILLTVLINPYNALVASGLLLIALALRSLSLRAITRLKQLESIARSPVFAHLSTTLSGLATIRAYGAEADFRARFDQRQDEHSAAWFAFMSTTRWLGQAVDWASVTFVSTVLAGAILLELDSASASLIGLLISHAIYMPGAFQAAMRQLVEAESQMTSVQRIKELCELECEPQVSPAGSDCARPARPARSLGLCPVGCIKFVDVSLRYGGAHEPPVLRSLNLLVRPRERVGIVGRTGAGKSSIIAILFRLYDFEGRVELDGRDTRQMSLEELRNSMSIIPQDPVLFAGTLRHNLDPFERHSDAELWRALEAVQLGSSVFARHPQGLEFPISEGGSNFSVGQRQLICLARAIVRKNKILILDEATANVDPETDVFIQRTIAQQFAHCTVLTIAHRLITVADSDRVMVLDRGEVSEFGPPHELLARGEAASLFAQMVASSGQQAPRLRRLIEEARASSTKEWK